MRRGARACKSAARRCESCRMKAPARRAARLPGRPPAPERARTQGWCTRSAAVGRCAGSLLSSPSSTERRSSLRGVGWGGAWTRGGGRSGWGAAAVSLAQVVAACEGWGVDAGRGQERTGRGSGERRSALRGEAARGAAGGTAALSRTRRGRAGGRAGSRARAGAPLLYKSYNLAPPGAPAGQRTGGRRADPPRSTPPSPQASSGAARGAGSPDGRVGGVAHRLGLDGGVQLVQGAALPGPGRERGGSAWSVAGAEGGLDGGVRLFQGAALRPMSGNETSVDEALRC